MFRRYSEGVRNPNAMARDCRKMGIHRDTVRRYIGAESPPTRRSRATPTTLTSDTITD